MVPHSKFSPDKSGKIIFRKMKIAPLKRSSDGGALMHVLKFDSKHAVLYGHGRENFRNEGREVSSSVMESTRKNSDFVVIY